MHLQRTTLSLPEPLMARLQVASRQAHISVSALAADLLTHALERARVSQSQVDLGLQYRELKKLEGIGPAGVVDASVTIDELLYGGGPNAVWRGHERP
jgi:hypothetical protein